MSYKQGDIVFVPFPFSDDTGSKFRPAIVISNNRVNNSLDIILAQITAKPRNDEFTPDL
jgi:mRNA interferase MazF